jgi:hypothetical protein
MIVHLQVCLLFQEHVGFHSRILTGLRAILLFFS